MDSRGAGTGENGGGTTDAKEKEANSNATMVYNTGEFISCCCCDDDAS